MVLEGLSSEKELGAWDLETGVDVSLDLVVVPGDDGGDGEVLEVPGHAPGLDLLDDACVHPVLVGEDNRGARALLS